MKNKTMFLKIFIIAVSVVLLNTVYGQNITNTLGTNGSFKIKDGVNTFFTLTQSNGYIEFNKSLKLQETTDINTGVIYKGTSPFIHNYKKTPSLGNNTFVGINSGNFTLGGANFADGSNNTGVGTSTLFSLTTGLNNTAVGYQSQMATTTGHSNVSIGSFSMITNSTGSFNIAIGLASLYYNTSGVGNTGIGYNSLTNNITGNSNVALGNSSLELNTSGSENVAIGKSTLNLNENGFRNTAVGTSVLFNCLGANNTAIGYDAGSNVTTGTNLTLIGNNAEPSSGTTTNQITLGNNNVTSLRCNVQTITSLSDARDKKNIKELPAGLDFISKLKPRLFNWDRREWYENNISDGSKMQEIPTAGFIAQELDETQTSENAEWLNLVLKDNPEKWEATYGNLIPVIVKAIQELKTENDKIKAENEQLKKEIESLKTVTERVTMLELIILKEQTLKEIKTAEK